MHSIRKFLFIFIFIFNILLVEYALSTDRIILDSEQHIYGNWISVTEQAFSESLKGNSVYDRLSDIFFDLYRKTNNEIYLRFSLYEAHSDKLEEIVNKLSYNELESVNDLVALKTDGKIESSIYIIRPYTFDDIYLFLDFDIPSNLQENARELLDHWLSRLPEYYRDSHLKGSFVSHSLILGYYQLADHQKVYEVSRYLQNTNPFPDSAFSLDLYLFLSYSLRISGYYLEALRLFQNILIPIALNLDNMQRYYEIRMDYAATQFRLGNVKVAFDEYQDIYSNIEYLTDPSQRTALLNNLAISYLNTGRFDQYVDFQLNAYNISQEEDNFGQQIAILRNLYIFYRRQNETDLAFSYIEHALQIAQEKNLTTDIATILLSLGVYRRTIEENPNRALEHFSEALSHAENYSNYQQIFNSYFEIAQTYLLLEDFETAEEYIRHIIDFSQSRNDKRSYILSNIILANSFIKSGRTEDAQSILAQFTSNDLEQLVFNFRVMAHNISMKVLMDQGGSSDAITQSTSMIAEIVDWLKESSNQETGHMRMDEEFSEAFRLHLNILQSVNRPQEALFTIGELRNITKSGFYNNPLLKSQLLSDEDLIRDYNLSIRIRQLRSRYVNAADEQKVYLSNELLAATSERNNLLNQAIPQYRETSYQSAMRGLSRQLRSDQMVLYISVFDGQVFRFAITRRKVDMKIFPKDDYYLDLVHNTTSYLGQGHSNLHDLHQVYTTFFEGVIPQQIKHIYFVPDGPFYMLPLEILPITTPRSSNSYGSTTYFVEKYSVSYANSLSEIVHERREIHDDFAYEIAGFGIRNFTDAGHPHLMDLPYGPEEIVRSTEALDRLSVKKLFLDYESTEANFREVAGKSKIIHIATHSKVNNDNPLFSTLYMHNGYSSNSGDETSINDNDGTIFAYELFDMNFNADLIFLSSCESGAGGYLQGTGILGFSRAFSYAGAQSLAMNLWPIRDQAATEIAVRFYESLNAGKNKAEALRDAQISYLNHYNSDPYLWGSFVLYGNIDPVISSNDLYQPAIILILVLLSSLIILFRFYK